MIVTLRKAHALSKGLLEAARKLPLERVVTVSIYADEAVEDRVAEAGEKLAGNLQVARSLIAAAYRIRDAVSAANHRANVDDLLNEKARLEATEKLLSKLTASEYDFDQAADAAIAPAKMAAILERNGQENRYGGVTEELKVKAVTPEIVSDVEASLGEIRRRKAEIADDLLAKNTSTTISLDADTVGLLKTFNLI